MATHHAVAAVSLALRELLDRRLRDADFPGARVALCDTTAAADADAPVEGLSLILYRVDVNTTLRRTPPRTVAEGRGLRPSLPVDLRYLLSAWSAEIPTQHALLGWALRQMEDMPVLSGQLINDTLATGVLSAGALGAEEAVELVAESLPLEAWLQLRNALGPCVGPSMTYVVRTLHIV